MLKARFGFVAAVLLLGLAPQRLAAANFNFATEATYRVEPDSTLVTERYTVTNRTSRQYLSEIKLTTATTDISELAVSYSDGARIPATLARKQSDKGGLSIDYQEISVKFPRQNYGATRWSFDIRYRTKSLVDSKGSSHTVYVPAVPELGAQDTYQVTVDVPLGFGTAHLAGAAARERQSGGGRQMFTFDQDSLRHHALALAFGDATIYKANFNFPLRNNYPWPQTLSVALPPDLNNQKSYLKSITPRPISTRLDRDGNVLAQYRLGPGQGLVVQTEVLSEVKYLEYDLAASGYKRDIPAELVASYTKPSQYWPTTGAVAAAAAKLNNDQVPTVQNVQAMYQFVIDKLSYNKDKIKFNIRQGADKALANPDNAVCLEYADLLVAMLRSQGIPARMPVGYGYSADLKSTSTVSDSLHAWVEAYVPGIGWMTLDPTWGEKFDQFGRSDLDHLAFAVWGEGDQSPAAIMAGSRDMGYQYEATTLAFESSVSPAPIGGRVNAIRYFILPFISLTRVSATADSIQATDSSWVRLGGRQFSLGSLAPGQTVTLNQPEINSSGRTAEYGRDDKSKPLILAASQIRINYWPMVILTVLTLAGGVYLVVIRLRPRNSNRESTLEPSS